MKQTRPKPPLHEPCPLIRGGRSSRRPNPVIETWAGVPGPWCVIRDALCLVSYARKTVVLLPLADHGATSLALNTRREYSHSTTALVHTAMRLMQALGSDDLSCPFRSVSAVVFAGFIRGIGTATKQGLQEIKLTPGVVTTLVDPGGRRARRSR